MAKQKEIPKWTYNKFLQVGEHTIEQPDLPVDLSKVYFIDDDPEDAFWDRSRMLKMFPTVWLDFIPGYTKINQDATLRDEDDILCSLSHEDTKTVTQTYIEEFERREKGFFFKNENEIVHGTGDMWFILMWCKTKRPDKKGDYFDFREFQRDFLSLVWYVNNHKVHEGLDISKPKKTGITNLMWLCFLNWATMRKNSNFANMNITQDKGAKTFRDHFMYAYHGLPAVIRPNVKSKSEPDGNIVFGKQYRASSKVKNLKNDSEDVLNTSVLCVPTSSTGFDIDVFAALWYDEGPKYTQNFGEIYRGNSEGTNLQDFNAGKKFLTSYTPEENSPSFLEAKGLFYDSLLKTITPKSNGRTKSKLICYHIPATRSWWTSFDKYGRCNEADALKKIMDGRDALKDRPRELLAQKRRYAIDMAEAWAVGGSGSTFDLIRLSELVTDLDKEARSNPEPLYQEGRLEWKNKLWEIGLRNKRPKGQFCEVEFVPLTDREREADEVGRLRIYQDIPVHLRNRVLRLGRDEWGNLNAPDEFLSILGADPVSHAAAGEIIQGSKNAFVVKNRANNGSDLQAGKIVTNIFTHVYFYRCEMPNESFEDLLKLIIYTGSLCAIEANVPEMATRLLEENMGNFILVKDKDGFERIWKRFMGMINEPDKKFHFFRTTSNNPETKKMLEAFVALYTYYIHRPVEGEKDYGATIKDERMLDQLMNVDITDTKLFDLFMAGGYCLYADEIYTSLKLAGSPDDEAEIYLGAMMRALSKAS